MAGDGCQREIGLGTAATLILGGPDRAKEAAPALYRRDQASKDFITEQQRGCTEDHGEGKMAPRAVAGRTPSRSLQNSYFSVVLRADSLLLRVKH